MIDFEITRSKRKTISLSVDRKGKVIVRAPLKMSLRAIEQFVQRHDDWISIRISHARNTVELSQQQRAELVKLAWEHIPVRVKHYSRIMEAEPCSIKITSAQARWGSCSYKNGLCFSYRLMLLEQDLIDYVIVHELAHIRVKNHSHEFYEEIEKYISDYKQRIDRLKAVQRELPY